MGLNKSFIKSSYIGCFCPTKLYSANYIYMVLVLLKTKTKKPLWNNDSPVVTENLKTAYQLELASWKSTMKTLEKCVKICWKLSIKTPEEPASWILVNVVKIKTNNGFTFIHFQNFLQQVFLKTTEKISGYKTFKTSMEMTHFLQQPEDNWITTNFRVVFPQCWNNAEANRSLFLTWSFLTKSGSIKSMKKMLCRCELLEGLPFP